MVQSVNSQFIHTHPMAQLYSSQRPRVVNRNREKKKGYSLVSDDRTEWDERSLEVWAVEMNGRSGEGKHKVNIECRKAEKDDAKYSR